ncbi:MAG: cell division protein FtsH [Candidatus Taylorbacteria bacterium RIFCSPLOWO2_12_FULL_44_15c]|uniref:ATP-dependent zinc metalloprotease FtsH n=1 Tax=Candidatus Taylorbacteria bacterium RIFCSPLOWO2_12_FULL_44_15c TaxID=1802333 RepID=A0A1G2P4Z5_9BACT|nr:MAG: cell division protein FtsH [Candidatus Taylorbacteria bacterium RIFCSPLOWO2_02_FULL_44_35]OHA43437.1 MAG: cell division protein FtsH [Candidatus Taylorbacteria bacterium RIFCSPLOWO2_12_FULL_44_15c]
MPLGNLLRNALGALMVFFLLSAVYSWLVGGTSNVPEISLSELSADITKGLVAKVTVNGEVVAIDYVEAGKVAQTKKETGTALSQTLLNLGVPKDKLDKVNINIEEQSGTGYWLLGLAPFLLPILFIAFFIWYLTRQMRGAGMQALSFGQSKARLTAPDDQKQKITFKDVAGVKEAKEELLEIVDFLKSPKRFLEIGARIPKGVLLMGPPGSGKTILSRAVAGEAGVPFFSISGSEFVEMFVGVGASRVRDLFQMAKKSAPAIIFIDEIDAVGRVRGGGLGGGNDEREQTLNQILVEMDGFEPNEKLIIMAATNRPDVLDPALLRPGRFDRRVVLDLPDRNDREEILKIHSRKKPFAEDVNLRVVAERTPGFSGADLYSLMNEGAILAARENRKKVSQFDLIRSIEKVMLGPERKSHLLSKKEKEITAYHEAGHALAASVLPFADPVHKISIISRGRAAGYTLKLPIEDRKLQSRREFLDDIAVSLAGYSAEKMIFGDLTTGPSNDLQVATGLARDMVAKYGMSEKLGPMAFEGQLGRPMFGYGFEGGVDYSERFGAVIDDEVARILSEAEKKAEEILTKHRPTLNAIATRLIETETIEREAFEKLLVANGITPKQKQDIEHQV